MRRLLNYTPLFAGAILAAGVCPYAAFAQLPANATVYASGLEGPRGLAFDGEGNLYVAEAGLGGTKSTIGVCAQVPAPIGPYKGGLTARISKITTKGKQSIFTKELPSAQDHQGDVLGVADVAFLNGELYAVLAGGGCSHGNPRHPNALVKIDLSTGGWTPVADLGLALNKYPAKYTSPDDYEPDGTYYGLIAHGSRLLTVEPNHGQVFSITRDGEVRQLIDVSASQGHIVPTSIVAVDQTLYVGNLNLFPIDPEWAKIMTLSRDTYVRNPLPGFREDEEDHRWSIVSSKAGFTTVVSMKIGPDGLLYVLELSAMAGYPTPGAGKVVRVKRSGVIEDVITGLTVPAGMTFGPDGRLYVSNLGAAPGAAGQVLRFDLNPSQD